MSGHHSLAKIVSAKLLLVATLSTTPTLLQAQSDNELPIADAHVHYSHDSVELTPPERVIEIMREAGLKFALVSSSDDNGTQLLSKLAPDLIIPGLRPYRRRGELSSWFTDPAALEYVEQLLSTNRYASIGEFHIYGDDAELPIPKRIVQLAEQHNLVLHAHADADAVERLLAQSDKVKVLWAHSGFDEPEAIAAMLAKHDRLWADLAFRSEVGSGGSLSKEWLALFKDHPDRMMLGTDTYTPERMYFIPSHADSARVWLKSLSDELAEKVAWKNAYDLLMPIWEENKQSSSTACNAVATTDKTILKSQNYSVHLEPTKTIQVGDAVSIKMTFCGDTAPNTSLSLDATMPAHGHGTNYKHEHSIEARSANTVQYLVEGVVLHMPGQWQWEVEVRAGGARETLTHSFSVQ